VRFEDRSLGRYPALVLHKAGAGWAGTHLNLVKVTLLPAAPPPYQPYQYVVLPSSIAFPLFLTTGYPAAVQMSADLPFRERPRSAEEVVLTNQRPRLSDQEQDEPLQPYEYRPLDTEAQEIRLLKLLPAENLDDDIEIEIFHAPLIEPEREPDTRLGFEELRETVPEGWELYKTMDDRYIFQSKMNGATQWNHPDPFIDQEKYHCDSVVDPYPGFEPAYEGR
jgi:hypothetical protein